MIEDDKPVLVGVWRGDNMRSILLALSQMGYTTATKVRVQNGRLVLKNLFERHVIQLGEQIWLPYVNEPKDETEEGGSPEADSGVLEGGAEELRGDCRPSEGESQRQAKGDGTTQD